MKKIFLISLIIFIIAIILFFCYTFLIVVGKISIFQSVSIEKKVYSVGEPINLTWYEFGLNSCTCGRSPKQKLFKSNDGWYEIDPKLPVDITRACINGHITMRPMMCDVISCSFPKPYFKKRYQILTTILIETGEINSCSGQNRTFKNYEYRNLTTGEYKVEFGYSKAYFSIK